MLMTAAGAAAADDAAGGDDDSYMPQDTQLSPSPISMHKTGTKSCGKIVPPPHTQALAGWSRCCGAARAQSKKTPKKGGDSAQSQQRIAIKILKTTTTTAADRVCFGGDVAACLFCGYLLLKLKFNKKPFLNI